MRRDKKREVAAARGDEKERKEGAIICIQCAVGFVLPGVIYFVHFFWREAGNIGTACVLTERGDHATPGVEEK